MNARWEKRSSGLSMPPRTPLHIEQQRKSACGPKQHTKDDLGARYQVTRLDFIWLVNMIWVQSFSFGVVEV